MANGTRTCPPITDGQTALIWSLGWVDSNDKEYSNSFLVKTAVTDIELEAVVATAQLASNASLFKAEKTYQWQGTRQKSNALDVAHQSIADKIRYSKKDLGQKAYVKAYIPAPLEELIDNENIVDTANVIYTNWRDAVDVAIAVAFVALNVEFVQYNQRNDTTSP